MNKDGRHRLEHIYQVFCRKAPNLSRLDAQYGSKSLKHYLQALESGCRSQRARGECDAVLKESFYRACRNYAVPLIGAEKTAQLIHSLDSGVINTANHMNVDTVGAYIQGNLLFGAMMHQLQPENTVIPLLAAATVPLTTSTFPKGFICRNQLGELIKIPLFKARYDNCFVANAPALTPENRKKADVHLDKIGDCYLRDTINSVLRQYYDGDALYQLDTYSQQITRLNFRISQQFVQDQAMQLVYIPMEEIARNMIVEQISNPSSLVYAMLFSSRVSTAVLDILAGDALLPRTDFFWGVDKNGRKCYLRYEFGKGYLIRDIYRNTLGDVYVCDDPEAVRTALLSQKLIPTAYYSIMLFMLSGVMQQAIGGFFQIDYFQTLKRSLYALFKISHGYIPHYIEELESLYLSGTSVIGVQIGDSIFSAGLFELLYAGEIAPQQLQKMLRISWKDSHLLSLQEMIFDLLPTLRAQSRQEAKNLRGVIDENNILFRI